MVENVLYVCNKNEMVKIRILYHSKWFQTVSVNYQSKCIQFNALTKVIVYFSQASHHCIVKFWQNATFSRAVWKYFGVEISCGQCADDMWMTREWDFGWDFTGGQHVICTLSVRHPHGMVTAVHKAYWLPCLNFRPSDKRNHLMMLVHCIVDKHDLLGVSW